MFKPFLLLLLTHSLFANYTNCDFLNDNYEDICKKVVKKGVSYEYANTFLLTKSKTKKFDEVSWKYLQPKHITQHSKYEKKANNVLVKYVPKMVENLREYKKVYDYSEKKYGVNREVIAGILLKETRLGVIKPKHDAFRVFNTMVIRSKAKTSREKWLLNMGKSNMSAIIEHCYKKGVKPQECNLPSSYAGAVGIPQFMPSSFSYSEGYKNRVADLTKMEDAILSASKFLHKKSKWTKLIEWSRIPDMQKTESAWYEYDFKNSHASFVYAKSKRANKSYNCFACNKKELAYTKEYVKKIMRYNNSSNYAVGVLRLAYDAHKQLKEK